MNGKFRRLFEDSAPPMWIHDAEGRILDANRSAQSLCGDSLAGRRLEELVADPLQRPRLFEPTSPFTFVDVGKVNGPGGATFEARCSVAAVDAGGPAFLVVLLALPEIDGADEPDVAPREARPVVSEIFDRVTDAFVALDSTWHYTYVNRRAGELFGRAPDQLIGRHIWTEFPEGIGQPFHRTYERVMETREPATIEEYYVPWDRWFENRIYPSASGIVIYFQDVTERRRREDELREARERVERTEAFALVMVTHVAPDGRFLKVPPTFASLLGYEHDALLAMTVLEVTHPDDRRMEQATLDRLTRGELRSCEIEKRFVRRDGATVWASVNRSVVSDPEGRLVHYIEYVRDITEKHGMEEQLRHQALHDDLTGLPNRALFLDRLEHAMDQAMPQDCCVGVLVIDLDGFKVVNDGHGHSFGDVLLREVAGRLRTMVRTSDTLARLGGDEFAVIVEDDCSRNQVVELAEAIRARLAERFEVGSHAVHLTASIGVSTGPFHGRDADTLIRNADNAMYRAKELGKDCVQLFDDSMSKRYRDRLRQTEELHVAIEQRQFLNHYQPLLRLSDRTIIGVEALIRWDHPTRGLVRPDEFISLAEETGLIVPIGELVLREACRDVQQWNNGRHPLRVSVNLSVRQFQQQNLLQTIDTVLAETGLDPSLLELEITESVAMKNVDYTMHLLRELRQRRISIAIDDFGSGHSSLIYLRQFPINAIKIDRLFIAEMEQDGSDAAIVRAVIRLGRDLGLGITAEGVENDQQLRILEAYGCDVVQGYLFSHPLPCEALQGLLDAVPRV